ncbi:MAG: hypothetical protein PHY30_01825 [Candidatus Pacebacteria bacterium]|nr:hypothetical protein [Candidatus Paceibacterota bacterium]
MRKRRPYKTKKRIARRNKNSFFKKKLFWFSFLFFVFGGGLSYIFFFSPYFQVNEVSVLGVQTIAKEEVLKNFERDGTMSLNILGNNLISESLFIPSQGKISLLLEKFPEIEDVNIKKDFFQQKIVIEVKEKTPVCIWCSDVKCVLLDKNATYIKDLEDEVGFIKVNEYAKYEDNLQAWSNKTKKDFLITIITVYKNNNDIKEFDIYVDKFFGKYKGIDFVFDPKEDLDWQIQKMSIILNKLNYNVDNIDYIDLRFGEQVVIK